MEFEHDQVSEEKAESVMVWKDCADSQLRPGSRAVTGYYLRAGLLTEGLLCL